ncbi:N-acetylmuramoyl-L-alanine amidase [Lysobacter helvus]|uniref:N-acetylmuramoyl-L-alanine amidase n=2 Tax=Lysobacteraceae TaxID=32033 RepID=A0ABM7Q7J1_9GAMM|nr:MULTISPECIES: N-acetylmuramoyl-L-alanine amidase [Lysobacter]BCT93371.1 N-acetylmuramoyl-L-alanine amidase [Lysobacter caseinilyticus]BCT96524.1 N-acetylmuramoyl-L-alanine amidase [Lysobacter helvus]
MRIKGATLQQWMLGAALVWALCWNIARASEIKDLAVTEGPTGTRAELRLDAPAKFTTLTLAGPDRLVVDLPESSLARGVRAPAGAGVVKAVRTGHPVPGTVRIVFDLALPVVALKPRIEPTADGARLVLEWPGDGTSANTAVANVPAPSAADDPIAAFATKEDESDAPPPVDTAAQAAASAQATSRLIAATTAPVNPPPATARRATTVIPNGTVSTGTLPAGTVSSSTVPTTIATGVPTKVAPTLPSPNSAMTTPPPGATKSMQQLMRGGMRPLIVAIDAGHGGQDPGARGANGSREKDLTLAIARELARQVNATPGLKAYLTRDTDVFIPLAQRYQKARAAKADLFVSIHADAFNNPEASGSSVFVLSQRGASSQAARWLANQENAADLVGGVRLQDKDNTLASVLLDLSQSATMKASEDIAGHVLTGLKRLGRTHKSSVERANFVVLRSPDVPSMLVETAFITNPDEERKLNDPRHRTELARAILDGVNTYFTRQPPPGTLYAARAEAAEQATASTAGSR